MAQHRGTLVDLEQFGIVGGGTLGGDRVLDTRGAQAPSVQGVIEAGRGAVAKEPRQQHLVEEGVLDADHLLVGPPQSPPMNYPVTC